MVDAAKQNGAAIEPVLVCPLTGDALYRDLDRLRTVSGSAYSIVDDIALLFVDEQAGSTAVNSGDAVTRSVKGFYEDAPFPNYNEFDHIGTFVKRAAESWFARRLAETIPPNSTVLEVGCGTGQISNYLAAACMARIYATDMTLASLHLGADFARRNNLAGIRFIQMNLFRPCIKPASIDVLIANGVLHHTHDTKLAFRSIAPMVKPGGHIVLGLYNHIGRMRTMFRRLLVRIFGERVLWLDPHLRKGLSPEKRRAWIKDQYFHPYERSHSMSEVLTWLNDYGFEFVSSLPPIRDDLSAETHLFARSNPGSAVERLMAEIGMLFSSFGKEGGLFIVIGRRKTVG